MGGPCPVSGARDPQTRPQVLLAAEPRCTCGKQESTAQTGIVIPSMQRVPLEKDVPIDIDVHALSTKVVQLFERTRADVQATLSFQEIELEKLLQRGFQSSPSKSGDASRKEHGTGSKTELATQKALVDDPRTSSQSANPWSQSAKATLSFQEIELEKLLQRGFQSSASKSGDVSRKEHGTWSQTELATQKALVDDPRTSSQSANPSLLKSFSAELGMIISETQRGDSRNDEWKRALMTDGEGGVRFFGNLSYTIPRMKQPVPQDSKLRKLSKSARYNLTRALVIMIDAILVVTVLQKAASSIENGNVQLTTDSFDVVLGVIAHMTFGFLLLDLLFHLILELPHVDLLFGRTGYRWFNILVLCQQGMDIVGCHISGLHSYSTDFRRIVAQFAVLRVMRFFISLPQVGGKALQSNLGELRIMIRVLTSALQPLLWCTLLITMILVIFGVFFAETTVGYLMAQGHASDPGLAELRESWGTVSKAMFSLYKAMFGGQEWGGLYDTMSVLNTGCKIGLLVFVCFTYVALLNTVTAVFIQVAFLRSDNDRELVVEKELEDKRDFLQTMRRIFCELDEDDSGVINFDELQTHLNNPEIGAYFSKLGVDCSEVEKLFHLLDEDGNKSIDKEEFMYGCLRLRGAAKSLDVALIHSELRFAIKCIRDLDRSMQRRIERLKPHGNAGGANSHWRRAMASTMPTPKEVYALAPVPFQTLSSDLKVLPKPTLPGQVCFSEAMTAEVRETAVEPEVRYLCPSSF